MPWQDRLDVQRPPTPLPCVVRAEFADGYAGEVVGHAMAWSERAVEALFFHPDSREPGPLYRTWVPLSWVRRLQPDDGDPPRLIPHHDGPGAPPPEGTQQDGQ